MLEDLHSLSFTSSCTAATLGSWLRQRHSHTSCYAKFIILLYFFRYSPEPRGVTLVWFRSSEGDNASLMQYKLFLALSCEVLLKLIDEICSISALCNIIPGTAAAHLSSSKCPLLHCPPMSYQLQQNSYKIFWFTFQVTTGIKLVQGFPEAWAKSLLSLEE